ncbi:MAG: hypothetical protein G01um101466_611, partial [Parcubacteria group bacterium Gr01-1014_66]
PEEVQRRIGIRTATGAIGGCRSIWHYFDDKERYEGIKLPHLVVLMQNGEEGLQRAVEQSLRYFNE